MNARGQGFSVSRLFAVLAKEFIQMRRDRVTFAMMIGIPIMQLMLFGFAINSDPRHLPTLVEMADTGPVSRALLAGMETSDYFDIRGLVASPAEADRALRDGQATFVVVIPPGFERDVRRGLAPEVLLSTDASDPTAAGAAVAALPGIVAGAVAEVWPDAPPPQPFAVTVHRQFNPEARTSTNIVPGLLGIILSMTMVMITAVAIVRESEKGTMETLLATPVRPIEVMAGKIAPYILVAYVQTAVFLVAARVVFDVPFLGSGGAFFLGFNLYVVVNLALGLLVSTLARNQMQAMQISFFTILPSVLLSGFMFPFAGMPGWAQALGSAIPATHFVRITRKVLLKGGGLPEILPDMAALLAILLVIVALALRRYRRTLD
ncbi:ABC-2 type transport system permease protein [Cereibacter ovatus]|uniref:ABC-2 type transport system permease protein n=1 Tax=Cereibacter ovatus TaxID=439529 RepID=A0A285CJD5_9RHOB|nr:ABC transporter permease [Cereibacter ovatus]SNX67711.1 ABC-2 type transport system permease protein [Cereibacter ovatus]